MEITKKAKQFLECEDPKELASILEIKTDSLYFFAYGRAKLYKEFEISKKSGGKRTINAPIGGLKSTQKKISEILNEIYKSPRSNHGFQKGRSAITNAQEHISKKVVLNLDLEEFFPSINSGRVMGLFKSYPFNFSKQMSSIMTGLLTYNNRLPQGAPSSPVISNMIAYRLDKDLIQIANDSRSRYTRYADDITFSTNLSEFSPKILSRTGSSFLLSNQIINTIGKNGFKINPMKTRSYSSIKSQWVTGIKVNKKLNLSRKYIRQIRSMLFSWDKHGLKKADNDYNYKFNKSRTKNFMQVVRGKIDYLKLIRGKDDSIYVKFYNRFVELEDKGREKIKSKIEKLMSCALVIESPSQTGSGFIINGKLITCNHVLEDNETVTFWKYDIQSSSEKKSAKVVYRNAKKDIAVLELCYPLDNFSSQLSHKTNSKINIGDQCVVFGYPNYNLGNTPTMTSSKINQIINNRYDFLDFKISDPMWKGMSGGPVLDTEGKVIGMATHGSTTLESSHSTPSHLFLGIDEIKEALFAVENQGTS